MTRDVTSFLNLPVYTNKGIYVGEIKNIIIDTDASRINSLVVTGTNPQISEDTPDLGIPFRWISAIGDIILLSYFPDKIKTNQEQTEENIEKHK
jgi:sporulation protein YlmC with PRC-barrel domain